MPLDADLQGAAALARGLSEVLVLTDADKAIGRRLRDLSRSRVPVRTGKLRGSVRALRGTVRSNLLYGPPIHWGWPKRHIRPNRFMWDTATDNEDEWVRTYREAIQQNMDKIE